MTPVPRWVGGACVGTFLVLAGVFAVDLIGKGPGLDELPPLKPEHYDPATVRKVPSAMMFDGAPCSSCHEGLEPNTGNPKERGVFHEAKKLQHGRNQHCFNCHHRADPTHFADFDGAPIKLADVQLLCAKCHGTTFRDWKNGSHGRRTGHWDLAKGGPRTTVCIACHDPHWPVFKAIEAAPGPHVNPRARERS
ncbi:MAG: hypothetical protein HYZ75_03760 [Elusimicrobia bacterium]|nr:hypothetical protein [Elusimicrobiota bacterium]